MTRLLYTTAEVAEMTGLQARKVRSLCREGRLAHHRIDAQYRFTMDQIQTLLAATVVEAEPVVEFTPLKGSRTPR